MKQLSYLFKIFILIFLIHSCANSNFTKRRYMKGVYVEKHSGARSQKRKAESKKFITQNDKNGQGEKKDENKIVPTKDFSEEILDKNELQPQEKFNHVSEDPLTKEVTETKLPIDESSLPKVSEEDEEELSKDPIVKKQITVGIILLILGVILAIIGFSSLFWFLVPVFYFLFVSAGIVMGIVGAVFLGVGLRNKRLGKDYKKIVQDIRVKKGTNWKGKLRKGFTLYLLGILMILIAFIAAIVAVFTYFLFALFAAIYLIYPGIIMLSIGLARVFLYLNVKGIKTEKNKSLVIGTFVLLLSLIPIGLLVPIFGFIFGTLGVWILLGLAIAIFIAALVMAILTLIELKKSYKKI